MFSGGSQTLHSNGHLFKQIKVVSEWFTMRYLHKQANNDQNGAGRMFF